MKIKVLAVLVFIVVGRLIYLNNALGNANVALGAEKQQTLQLATAMNCVHQSPRGFKETRPLGNATTQASVPLHTSQDNGKTALVTVPVNNCTRRGVPNSASAATR